MPMFGKNAYEDYAILNYLHSQIMRGVPAKRSGQRDPRLTRSALARPYRSAFGIEMYYDEFLKAAALLDAVVNNVVFKDGNKRTALAAATLYLALNKRVVRYGVNEAEWFMYQVVMAHPRIEEIAAWLRQHCSQPQLQ